MQIKQLWDAPNESWNGCSDIKFEFDGMNAKLLITFLSNKVTKTVIVNFLHAICYKHEANYLFMPGDTMLECLCQVYDSEWLKNLKDFSPKFPNGEFKHFIFDNQNDGRFEVIAEDYFIE